MMVKISIIIPTYNAEKRIEETLVSIEKQLYLNYEIIIMDAISSDNTANIVEMYAKKNSKIKYISSEDNGIYDAMNKGVKIADGEYCIFLGAGDTLHDENVLLEVAQEVEKYAPDVIYGYVIALENQRRFEMKSMIDFWYTLKFRPVCHQAVVAKKTLLNRYPFDLNYKIAADQEWLMHMKKKKRTFLYINRVISFYPRDGISSSAEGGKQSVYEQDLIQKKYYPIRRIIKKIYYGIKNKLIKYV